MGRKSCSCSSFPVWKAPSVLLQQGCSSTPRISWEFEQPESEEDCPSLLPGFGNLWPRGFPWAKDSVHPCGGLKLATVWSTRHLFTVSLGLPPFLAAPCFPGCPWSRSRGGKLSGGHVHECDKEQAGCAVWFSAMCHSRFPLIAMETVPSVLDDSIQCGMEGSTISEYFYMSAFLMKTHTKGNF